MPDRRKDVARQVGALSGKAVALRIYSGALSRKPRHQFDVRRIQKLVDRGDALDSVTAVDQDARVAGKGRDIARHRDPPRDLARGEPFGLRLCTLPWRVEHDRIEVA